MDSAVIVAIISGVCTLLGSCGGVLASSRLTTYRIQQLELRVDKHNHLVERMYEVEKKQAVQEDEIQTANHRIADLEQEVKDEH